MLINLLPWREMQHKKRQRNFYLLMAVMFGSTLVIWLILTINYLVIWMYQQPQLMQLQQQLTNVVTKIRPYLAAQKLQQQQRLQTAFLHSEHQHYQLLLQLLQALSIAIPNGVYLTSLQKKDHIFYISGKSISHMDISLLLKRLENFAPQAQLQLTETRYNPSATMNIDFDLAYNPQKK